MRTAIRRPADAMHAEALGSKGAPVQNVLAASPRMTRQRQSLESVQRSPRMNAQHKEMAILSGQAALRDEEEEKRPVAQAKKKEISRAHGTPGRAPVAQLARAPKIGHEWQKIKRDAFAYRSKVKDVLEDDDDVKDLKAQVNKIASMAAELQRLSGLRLKAKPVEGRYTRSSVKNRGIGGSKKPTREYYDRKIESGLKALRQAWAVLKKSWSVGGGGFSAKGRAHAGLGEEILDLATGSAKTVDNSFLKNIRINGTRLTDVKKSVKSTPKVATEAAGPVIVQGAAQNSAQAAPLGLLAQTDQGIAALNGNASGDWNRHFVNTPAAKPRGTGQYANMNNTNATGYAWMTGVAGWRTQRWEWLHVRGAGLGGSTDGSNLVVGTRDSNTHMIPFESNVRALATEAGKNPHYRYLDMKWSVSGKSHPHQVSRISMTWKLIAKPSSAPAPEPKGVAHFAPLATGANISKTEVDFLEHALKTARETVKK